MYKNLNGYAIDEAMPAQHYSVPKFNIFPNRFVTHRSKLQKSHKTNKFWIIFRFAMHLSMSVCSSAQLCGVEGKHSLVRSFKFANECENDLCWSKDAHTRPRQKQRTPLLCFVQRIYHINFLSYSKREKISRAQPVLWSMKI